MIVTLENTHRLVLTAMASPITDDELSSWIPTIRQRFSSAPTPLIVFTDLRRVFSLSSDTNDKFVWMLRRDNPKVQRASFLIPPNKALAALWQNMLTEAKNDARQAFSSVSDAVEWLKPVLTPEEALILNAFVIDNQF